jgi:hypothetical protein
VVIVFSSFISAVPKRGSSRHWPGRRAEMPAQVPLIERMLFA